ncbi:unnamed protein product [Adineta steineri]|uniref:Phytanoyl-CoA dioxygenase n=1 Tax=Adineta steineri TaxID=433720 RepID=A0A819YUT7_9BILA|nr:unnamed protein product [Adineta steineri]CAF4161150.1 unnamed protein product [Adineta steineri]
MNTPFLLTDKQVQDFLINGYLVLQTISLHENYHSSIFTEALSIFTKEGNPGNNILPRIPQLQSVFDDPIVNGALVSLLGSNYTMQPSRYAHLSKPGCKAEQWHKDSYYGYKKLLRHHQLRYIMAIYYPQNTTIEMGSTAIKPRSQYDVMDPKINGNNDMENDVCMTYAAGTVVLIHYDIVHRRTVNRTKDTYCFMFKFQFNRLEEPTKPTWNHNSMNAAYDAGLLQPIVKHIWNGMMGGVNIRQQLSIDQDILEWERQLNDIDGKLRLNAAYNLALSNQYKILINHLYKIKETSRLEVVYALTACRHNKDAISELQTILKKEEKNEYLASCIAFIFSEMGSVALETLPLLIHIIETNDSWLVKQYCCEALGTIQSNDQHDIDMVIRCLTHILANRDQQMDSKEASHTRFTAALSLAKIGGNAVEAIPVLKDALYFDPNRYVNGNALLALERIGTSEALKIVWNYLKTSRWCAKTSPASLF